MANSGTKMEAGPPPPVSPNLLQQFQNKLLLLVGLGQRGDAGLFQDGVLGHVCDGSRNISRRDPVFRGGQVLDLVVDDVAGALQAVYARAEMAAQCGYLLRWRC